MANIKCFYSDRYFIQLPSDHPFPMHKYPDAASLLRNSRWADRIEIIDAGLASHEDLLLVHDPEYIAAIEDQTLSGYALRKLGFPLSHALTIRSRAAVAGTVAAVQAALRDGLSINLAGGTHHSFADRGEGYCVYNDVAIAIKKYLATTSDTTVLSLDLDAHQGNGTNSILHNEPRVESVSLHVRDNYPSRKVPSTKDIGFDRYVDGKTYLQALESYLSDWHLACGTTVPPPALVIYNAGVDVHMDDRFGQMRLTDQDVAHREELVMHYVMERAGVPLVIVFGGGYNKTKAKTPLLHFRTIEASLACYFKN